MGKISINFSWKSYHLDTQFVFVCVQNKKPLAGPWIIVGTGDSVFHTSNLFIFISMYPYIRCNTCSHGWVSKEYMFKLPFYKYICLFWQICNMFLYAKFDEKISLGRGDGGALTFIWCSDLYSRMFTQHSLSSSNPSIGQGRRRWGGSVASSSGVE